jgi:hypothetical protein
MEQHALENANNCLNTNIYSYLETSGGQSSNLYLELFIFSTPVLISHLWQLKTVIFLHWCLLCAVLLNLSGIKVINPVCKKELEGEKEDGILLITV